MNAMQLITLFALCRFEAERVLVAPLRNEEVNT